MDTDLAELPKWKRHYIKRRRQVLEKMGGECIRCGTKDNLEIDHVDPKLKSFSISEFITHSWKKIEPELSKCQLLCVDCHKRKSLTDGSLEKLHVARLASPPQVSRDECGRFINSNN